MSTRARNIIIATIIGFTSNLQSVSIVYNLRIAQTTRRQALQEKNRGFTGAITVFDQFRTTRDDAHQNTLGGLGTLIYSSPSFYYRVDSAAGRVRTIKDGLRFSRTQTDDILFSAGYSHDLGQRTKVTYSGLLGLPTHNDLGLQGIQLGTGHIGVGAQLDGSFSYTDDGNKMLMAAARIIQFFPRTVDFQVDDHLTHFDINIGKLADILIGHYCRWENHRLEVGYNSTFAFQASIHPHLDEVVARTHFIRSSWYAAYQYRFLINKLPSAISVGLSYGFDHAPKRFGIKRGGTIWALWGVSF